MKDDLSYNREDVFSEEIVQFIDDMDIFFVPTIQSQNSLDSFVKKVLESGVILSCRNNFNEVAGLSMFYANDTLNKTCYLSYIAVKEQRGGIGKKLLKMTESVAFGEGMDRIILKTNSSNEKAIKFYKKNLFTVLEETEDKGRIAVIFEKKI